MKVDQVLPCVSQGKIYLALLVAPGHVSVSAKGTKDGNGHAAQHHALQALTSPGHMDLPTGQLQPS